MKNPLKILAFTIILSLALGVTLALAEEKLQPKDVPTLEQEWAECGLNYDSISKRYYKAAQDINASTVVITSEICLLVLRAEMVITSAGEDCLELGTALLKTDTTNKKFIVKIDKQIKEGVKSFRKAITEHSQNCLKIKEIEKSVKPKQEIY